MAKVTLIPEARFNRKIARLPGVRRAVDEEAEKIAVKARRNLGKHYDKGDTMIFVEKDGVDARVVMTGPNENVKGSVAVLAQEFGWEGYEGLHILAHAAGIL